MKAIIKAKAITAALIIILSTGFTHPASSADKNDTPVELQFVGKFSTGPMFQLKLNNPDTGEYLIKVKDGDGNLLFSEKLKGISLTRNYRIDVNEEELYGFKLQFEVTNVMTKQTSVYKVSNKNRIVNDIIVAKL